MKIHRQRLNDLFQQDWPSTPTYVAIRHLLIGLDTKALEKVVRQQGKALLGSAEELPCFAINGKALRGSAQRLEDSSYCRCAHIKRRCLPNLHECGNSGTDALHGAKHPESQSS